MTPFENGHFQKLFSLLLLLLVVPKVVMAVAVDGLVKQCVAGVASIGWAGPSHPRRAHIYVAHRVKHALKEADLHALPPIEPAFSGLVALCGP